MVTIARMPCYSFANATRFAHNEHWHVIVSSIKSEDEYYCCTLTHTQRASGEQCALAHALRGPLPTNGTHFYYFAHSRIQFIIVNYNIFHLPCRHRHCAALRELFVFDDFFLKYINSCSESSKFFFLWFGIRSPPLLPLCTNTTMRIDCFYFVEEICLHTENVAIIKCELCWKARALSLSPSCSFITSTSISIPHSHKHARARQHPVNAKWCCGWRSRQRITFLIFANSIWIEWHIVGRLAASNTIYIYSCSVLSNNIQLVVHTATDVMTRAR